MSDANSEGLTEIERKAVQLLGRRLDTLGALIRQTCNDQRCIDEAANAAELCRIIDASVSAREAICEAMRVDWP